MFVRLLLGLVIAYAVFLRFDAVTLVHGPVQTPAWIGALQETRPSISVLRPEGMQWSRWEGRYISDPYTYLQFAREPRGFYDAHRREPIFVFATRASLWVFGDQDLAVSWASALFSVLAVWGTFLLGRLVWSPAVGLLAAAGLAIEMTVITWAVGGWRDEAFMCAVLFTAHALLRLRQSPTPANAAWFGVVSAAACLVRITALSFVVPAFVIAWWLVALPSRARVRTLGIAVLTMVVLVAPYLINCWREFGDPLHAINVHADVYREAEGQTVESSQTAREYLTQGWRVRPMQTLDTAIQGMTTYPFTNKWDGFTVWHPWLPSIAATAGVVGLLGLLLTVPGRVVLGLLAASLVPYALTWHLIGDWRFTAHAYPVFLVAAASSVVALSHVVRPAWWQRVREWPRPSRWTLGAAGAGAVLCLAAVWWSVVLLPVAVAPERLRLDGGVTLATGPRDRWFFLDGWESPQRQGNVTVRHSMGSTASVRVPTLPGHAYDLVLRMDPFPSPADTGRLPSVRLFSDGRPAGRLQLAWDPHRIGYYVAPMPATQKRSAVVQLMVDHDGVTSDRLRLWWVQVRLH
jgi:4-amino-4-deoxy-L-arabinose transferase-like glycosyltransferase